MTGFMLHVLNMPEALQCPPITCKELFSFKLPTFQFTSRFYKLILSMLAYRLFREVSLHSFRLLQLTVSSL